MPRIRTPRPGTPDIITFTPTYIDTPVLSTSTRKRRWLDIYAGTCPECLGALIWINDWRRGINPGLRCESCGVTPSPPHAITDYDKIRQIMIVRDSGKNKQTTSRCPNCGSVHAGLYHDCINVCEHCGCEFKTNGSRYKSSDYEGVLIICNNEACCYPYLAKIESEFCTNCGDNLTEAQKETISIHKGRMGDIAVQRAGLLTKKSSDVLEAKNRSKEFYVELVKAKSNLNSMISKCQNLSGFTGGGLESDHSEIRNFIDITRNCMRSWSRIECALKSYLLQNKLS